MRNRLLCSTAAIAIATALSGPVKAADLPIKAPQQVVVPSWAGWYGGVTGGWVGARYNAEAFQDDPNTGLTSRFSPCDGLVVGVVDPNACNLNQRFSGHGFGLGVLAGYNWQTGPWVYGIEADGTGLFGVKNTVCKGNDFPALPGSCTKAVITSETAWIASLRGRLGMTFDRTLVYATGGVAVAGVNYDMAKTDTSVHKHLAKVGAVVGAGVEHQIGPTLNVRLEGLYYMFNDKSTYVVDTCCNNVQMKPGIQNAATVRVGLIWRPQLY